MADRIQYLRKAKGLSQEELADKIGVSRQAVSKWESEQSTPEIENVVIMSDVFEVTTDYILKGIEPVTGKEQKSKTNIGNVLYIASNALVASGLLCALGGWHARQTMVAVFGGMVIQVLGIAGYFTGKALSGEKAPLFTTWFNMVGAVFMPLSMATGFVSVLVFKQGWVAPYPVDIFHGLLFGGVFIAFSLASYRVLKSRE